MPIGVSILKFNMEVKILSQHHLISRKVDQIQSKKQIEVYSSFLPDEILTRSPKNNELIHYDGVVLLIDISDVNILSRINTKVAQEGISMADASINAYLSAIIEVVHFYEGDIQKLIPDNMIVVWKSKRELRLYKLIDTAITCALNIQRVVEHFDREIGVHFQIKQIISCGNISFGIIGNKISKSWVIIGNMMQDCRFARLAAKPTEILVTRCAWGHLNENRYLVNYTVEGYVQVNTIFLDINSSLRIARSVLLEFIWKFLPCKLASTSCKKVKVFLNISLYKSSILDMEFNFIKTIDSFFISDCQ